jgi:PIN domain nuclease of toxin-antitoxin system
LKLLLDTHALLWFGLNDPQLSAAAMTLIVEPSNEKLVSPASYWEIAMKIGLRKYALNKPYQDFMLEAIDNNGFGYLHIEPKHTALLTTLPPHHKDPFDRLLVAQALVEGVSIVSGDTRLDAYSVLRLW